LTTTERPTIEEQYITAQGSQPVIAAAALASIGEEKDRVELALLLWDVTYKGKSERQKELAERLGRVLKERMQRSKWLKGDPWKIAKEMVAWHLHGICTNCDGRGHEQIKDTPSLSNNLCNVCHGTGKRPHPREASHVWMAGYLSTLTTTAGAETMKRLRAKMDL
jgi:DnaJ-class molecular chaperone